MESIVVVTGVRFGHDNFHKNSPDNSPDSSLNPK